MENNYWNHKTCEIEEGAEIGSGTKVWHNSQIKKGAKIGKNCTIGHNCFIGGEAVIGNNVKIQSNTDVWDKVSLEDYVFVGPSVVFTNDKNPRSKYPKLKEEWITTLIKEGSTLGANSTIVCGITIGRSAMIGAGAVVTRDVPDYAIIIGVPAVIAGWICECGNKIEFEKEETSCVKCNRKYRKDNNLVVQIS